MTPFIGFYREKRSILMLTCLDTGYVAQVVVAGQRRSPPLPLSVMPVLLPRLMITGLVSVALAFAALRAQVSRG